MVRDYTTVEIDDDKNPLKYDRKERIAELTKRLIGYGYGPDYINKKALGRRFGVSNTQIYRDLQVIAKSIEEYKHIDNLDVDESFEAWIEGHDLDLAPDTKTEKANKNGLPEGVSYDELSDSVKSKFQNPNNTDNRDKRQQKPEDKPSYEEKVKGENKSSETKDGRPRKPEDIPNYQSGNKSSETNNQRPRKPKDIPNYQSGNKSSETNNQRPRKPKDIPNYQSGNKSSEKSHQSNEEYDFIPYDQLPEEVKEAKPRKAWERADPRVKERLSNDIKEKKAKGVYD